MTETLLRVKREDGCKCELAIEESGKWALFGWAGHGSHHMPICPHGSTVEVIEYALPDGVDTLGWTEDDKRGRIDCLIEGCDEYRWEWSCDLFVEGRDPRLLGEGYAATFEEARRAITDAEERWRQGE